MVDNPDDEMSCTFRAQLPPSRHDNHKALRTAIDASRLTSSAVSNTPSDSLHAYHHHRRFDHVMQHTSRTLKNIKALPANDFHSATSTFTWEYEDGRLKGTSVAKEDLSVSRDDKVSFATTPVLRRIVGLVLEEGRW